MSLADADSVGARPYRVLIGGDGTDRYPSGSIVAADGSCSRWYRVAKFYRSARVAALITCLARPRYIFDVAETFPILSESAKVVAGARFRYFLLRTRLLLAA
jgi:hypothetical protein